MKNLLIYLLGAFPSLLNTSIGQTVKSSKTLIAENIELWNLSFNKRDTVAYFNLVDSGIVFTAGGGTDLGIAGNILSVFI